MPRLSLPKGSLLSPFDPWSSPLCTCPVKYSLNPYTGCSIGCLYCYATAYIGRRPSTPKRDAVRRLRRDLRRLPRSIPVNMGTSSDPYPPEEEYYKLTRALLEVLVEEGVKVLITTKSDLVVRDVDLIARGRVAVTPTITMLDARMSRIVEPMAPEPSRRISAVRALAHHGVPVGVRVDPVIPYVNDDPHMLEELVCTLAEAGARFVVTSTYKARPDNMARMRAGLGEVGDKIYRLYRERGVRVGGYTYLPREDRERLLKPVVRAASRCGMEYATCREGLTGPEWFNAASCDGTHLIPERREARGGAGIDRWLAREGPDGGPRRGLAG